MSNATEIMAGRGNVMPTELGSKFIRWGLGLFILGFIVGFIPILHYIHGAVAGDVGPAFLKNMTLWWGCPAVLMEYALKMGSLGMVAIGLCYLVLPRAGAAAPVSGGERVAPMLCLGGLHLAERLSISSLVPSFVSTAEARVGRPLTPVSVAGVARRSVRRCAYGVTCY